MLQRGSRPLLPPEVGASPTPTYQRQLPQKTDGTGLSVLLQLIGVTGLMGDICAPKVRGGGVAIGKTANVSTLFPPLLSFNHELSRAIKTGEEWPNMHNNQ